MIKLFEEGIFMGIIKKNNFLSKKDDCEEYTYLWVILYFFGLRFANGFEKSKIFALNKFCSISIFQPVFF